MDILFIEDIIMQILHPYEDGKFTPLTDCTNAIFLAGPCPRTTDEHWFD